MKIKGKSICIEIIKFKKHVFLCIHLKLIFRIRLCCCILFFNVKNVNIQYNAPETSFRFLVGFVLLDL